jgi:hypothetical protein
MVAPPSYERTVLIGLRSSIVTDRVQPLCLSPPMRVGVVDAVLYYLSRPATVIFLKSSYY